RTTYTTRHTSPIHETPNTYTNDTSAKTKDVTTPAARARQRAVAALSRIRVLRTEITTRIRPIAASRRLQAYTPRPTGRPEYPPHKKSTVNQVASFRPRSSSYPVFGPFSHEVAVARTSVTRTSAL